MVLITVLFFFFFSEMCFSMIFQYFFFRWSAILLTIGKPTHTKATLPNYKTSHWRRKIRLWVGYSWDLQNHQPLNCSELNYRLQF